MYVLLYVYIQSEAAVVLTPPTELTLSVEGPMENLEAGSMYSLNVTIQHNSSESLDAHNIVVGIDELSHISFHTDIYVETGDSNGTLLTSGIFSCLNGNKIIIGDIQYPLFMFNFVDVSVLLGSGLSIPVLHTNDTIHLYLTFSVNPRTRLKSTVSIPFCLVYFNSGIQNTSQYNYMQM